MGGEPLRTFSRFIFEPCWKLLLGTVVMLAFGYAGETNLLEAWIGFFFGMCGWGYILFEIFKRDAGDVCGGVLSSSEGELHAVVVVVVVVVVVMGGG